MRKIHGLMRSAVIAAAASAAALMGHVPTADAGGRGGVSISFGFPVGDHGYVSVGSHRGWGHHRSYHHGYSSYRYGYHHGYRYNDCHYRPVYVRPISRVCYDPWRGYYGHRSRAVVYGTSHAYRYSSADDLRDDTRVYNVAHDNASYMSSQSLVAESSLPSDSSYVDRGINNEVTTSRPGYARQRRDTTTASRPYIRQAPVTVSIDDAFAMLDRGEGAEAQRAFAGLIARNPRPSRNVQANHATVGYGLASAALGQVERAERAFAQASAANANVWDTLGRYPAARSMAVTLLGDSTFADSTVMRAPLDRLSVAAEPNDLSMPALGNKVAGRE